MKVLSVHIHDIQIRTEEMEY